MCGGRKCLRRCSLMRWRKLLLSGLELSWLTTAVQRAASWVISLSQSRVWNLDMCVWTLLSGLSGTACIIMNCIFPWCCRRYDRWLRSSLSGLYRAERCEEPHRGTTIQGKTILASITNRQHGYALVWNWYFNPPSFQLDISLQQDSAVYKSFRIKGSIGPMRVQLVAEGAFKEVRKQMMAFSNTSPNTFKMHRVLRRKEYADFLLGKTVSWRQKEEKLWRMWTVVRTYWT